MTLTPEQQRQLLSLKAQGLTKEQAFARVFSAQQAPRRDSESGLMDVFNAGRGAVSDLGQRSSNIMDSFRAKKQGEQSVVETGAQLAGNVLGGAGDLGFRAVQAVATPFLTKPQETAIADTARKAVEATGIPQAVEQMSPRAQRNITAGTGLLEGLTAGLGSNITRPISRLFRGTPKLETTNIPSAVSKLDSTNVAKAPKTTDPIKVADSVFKNTEARIKADAKDQNLTPKEREEIANSSLSFSERWIGLTPDVKKRLGEMGPEKLQEYLDATHLRNINDTAPTPYEVGSKNVSDAEAKLYETLNTTGSEIGQTRAKLATYQMNQPQVKLIEDKFIQELNRLKLTINNGEIVQTKGTISPVAQGDLNALNSLYQDLRTFKQAPNLANAIDLRKNFDGKIKFGKSARDVSNEVDPLSRSVRSAIADEAAKLVGKEQAAELTKYSDFMDAYGDLKSFTDRAAGGEYLLRLVLSGRGGEARKLIETIKQYTGVDLMNDATAMKVATETLGNEATQNLFRQEVTKAGYDAMAVISEGPTGVLSVIGKKLLEKGIDPEEVLKKAAGAGGALYVANLMVQNPESIKDIQELLSTSGSKPQES